MNTLGRVQVVNSNPYRQSPRARTGRGASKGLPIPIPTPPDNESTSCRLAGRITREYRGCDTTVFCLDDPTSGPALFRLSDQIKSKTYEIGRTRVNARPRKVRFGEHGTTLVCGSDHGCVYVFDTRSSEKLATLSVGSTEWVQVVATAEVEDVSVIFAAQTRALDCSEEIFVWKRAQPVRKTGTLWETLIWIAKALVVLGCVAFVYQNLEAKDFIIVQAAVAN
ncbi:hypothetical protein DFH07DRAFT_973148 [Mycena maculata]|uniref:WD40 repeat-like protein n=1 Tax=Mycena maculata TaxID=230809 RepID=A0AAD7HBT2_9AGAR|nr:hypothetical protein DFH07DRAFT_973701 [Mycena maculata]KAJ7718763.1 hypothetical protein DFH07DRAFT_973148 [Mycena maculata]